MPFIIRSSACYLPQKKVTAEELDTVLGLKEGTCRQRYGVAHRQYASAEESSLYMGAEAAKRALQEADMELEDIDLLLCACATSHQALPYNAAGMLYQLGASTPIASMDVNASCLSFLAALEVANDSIATGRYRRVLIISSEVANVGVKTDKAEIATLFADGAAAFIVEQSDDGVRLESSLFQTFPEGYSLCQIRAGGSAMHPSRHSLEAFTDAGYFEMQGKSLYKMVAKLAPNFIQQGLNQCNMALSEVDYVVLHQASHAGLLHLTKQLKIDSDKVINIFSTMGNQIAASLPIALHYLLTNKPTKKGQKILLFGSAAGLSLGLGVLTL